MSLDDVKLRDQYVADCWLRCDDLDDLRIYTYTNKTVFEKHWDKITLNSRGHIFNRRTGECVARPFPKFFNVGERPDDEPDLWGPCHVFEKLDGWLGVLYRHDGQYKISTRGSFKSIGAIWATKFLQENHDLSQLTDYLMNNEEVSPNDFTLIFELIHPSLREESNLVVNYGDREDLVLLAGFNRHTGREINFKVIKSIAKICGFSRPEVYNGYTAYNAITAAKNMRMDQEGFVVRFSCGTRVKVKGDEYVKASQAIRLLTPGNIWKNMHDGVVYDAFLDIFPDDFREKATSIACNLELGYAEIETQALWEFYAIKLQGFKNRRDFAEQAKKCKHTSAMFCLLDNEVKRFDNCIMQRLRERIKSEKMQS